METRAAPPEPTFLTLVLKTFAGFGAGAIGTIVLLVIFLLGASILQPTFTGTEGEPLHPLFIFVFMAMVFLTSLASNITGPLFFSFIQQDKYSRRQTAITQIFIVNIVILAILAPIYLLIFASGFDLTAFLAGIHVLAAAIASMMILEIIGNLRYSLVGVYGSTFSLLFAIGVVFLIYQFSGRNVVILLFSALPVIWTFMGFISVIVEMFYSWLNRLYGVDFLAATTSFGREYGEPEEEEEIKEDVSGAEFLKKK